MALSPELTISAAAASLFCDEEASWDDDDEEVCGGVPPSPPINAAAAVPLPADGNGRSVTTLVAAELDLSPRPDYLSCSSVVDIAARQAAVSWILKVNEFHSFRPVTACLAVNYLDRFLSSHTLPVPGEGENGDGWPMQLLSVACVSVAAKMEETQVPILLDLQVLEPRFVFEQRTVRRMELLLMAALQWRMRAVTPFDFFEPIAGAAAAAQCCGLVPRAAELVLSTLRVVDFLRYPPSAIAAASLLCAADELAVHPSSLVIDLNGFPESFRSVTTIQCRQLMDDYVIDMCPFASRRRCRSSAEPPPSPAGVLDAVAACSSCDTRSLFVTDVPPAPKRRRRNRGDARCTAASIIDTGGDCSFC